MSHRYVQRYSNIAIDFYNKHDKLIELFIHVHEHWYYRYNYFDT